MNVLKFQSAIKQKFSTYFPRIMHDRYAPARDKIAFPQIFPEFLSDLWITMIANYYTLRHIALDLHRRLKNLLITELFTQNKNELIIRCEDETGNVHVVVSCEPVRNFTLLRETFHRAKKNSVDLFKKLSGARVLEVSIHPNDREITIRTDTRHRLLLQMFGSKANVLLVDENNMIADSFLKPKQFIGKQFEESRASAIPPLDLNGLEQKLKEHSQVSVFAALKELYPTLGNVLIHKILFRSTVDEERLIGNLSDADKKLLVEIVFTLVDQLKNAPSPRIYYDENEPVMFSIVPLHHVGNYHEERFDSLHEAIRKFLSASQRQKLFLEQKKSLVQFLQQNFERTERSLKKIADETESVERAATYETIGKLLMANLHALSKGIKQVELENIFSPTRERVTIKLNPGQPPPANAERYFEKAKQARRALQEQTKRKEILKQRLQFFQKLLAELELIDQSEDYNDFLTSNRELLKEFGFAVDEKDKSKQEIPFRVFTVAGGFQVWAGKNNENNDLLTMKYAKPNDLWFHARGASGSHVVLKVGTSKGEPSKQAIEQAASIAAYYSKMKNAKAVPVVMTQRKYVRKPKGAPAGTVRVEREKLLFVESKLPKQTSPT